MWWHMIETPLYPEIALRGYGAPTSTINPRVVAALSFTALVGLWFVGNGQLLRLAIPTAAAVVALVLYRSLPVVYVQYSLWVWFLTPLVRRVVDWRCGWADPNIILLSPFLVSGVVAIAFLKKDSKAAWSEIPAAFVLCAMAILYGFTIGMLLKPSPELAFGLLNWLCPLLFGLHFYQNWPKYEQHRAAISKSFLWAILVLGAYGTYQFVNPTSWDCFWLENVQRVAGASFGQPQPFLIRVWSTMNAPGPFANTIMMGLLLLFAIRSPWKLPAAAAGYTSFLLSMVRTAWLSWIIGFFWILKNAKPRVMVRVVLSIALLAVCLIPVISNPRLATVISDRLQTFTDLKRDDSFGARIEMYRVLTNQAIENPFGEGVQTLEVFHGIAVDSGILILVFSLGWLGTLLFTVGMLSLFWRRSRFPQKMDDFSIVAKAGMIAMLAQVVGGNIFVGVSGAMFWTFSGMYLASGKYHEIASE